MNTQEKMAIYEPRREAWSRVSLTAWEPALRHLDLGPPASGTETAHWCCSSRPACGTVTAARAGHGSPHHARSRRLSTGSGLQPGGGPASGTLLTGQGLRRLRRPGQEVEDRVNVQGAPQGPAGLAEPTDLPTGAPSLCTSPGHHPARHPHPRSLTSAHWGLAGSRGG